MNNDKRQTHSIMNTVERCYEHGGKLVKNLLLILVIALVIFQVCLHIPSLRGYVSSVYKLDGVLVEDNNVKDWYEKLD
ncbi:hypothetical protein J2T13_004537 [Paenibacillus sp. DS2015]|uniref:hypothetical protein n=1 Tax=Paenibacillus sp. DS2015 TaxID=3373917 RepID=UPI003D1A0670